MYIHLGEDVIIRVRDIIAVLDKESVKDSKDLLSALCSQDNKTASLFHTSYKSIIITNNTIYLSPLASNTIKKRSQRYMELED